MVAMASPFLGGSLSLLYTAAVLSLRGSLWPQKKASGKAGSAAPLVEMLVSIHEALGSILSTEQRQWYAPVILPSE